MYIMMVRIMVMVVGDYANISDSLGARYIYSLYVWIRMILINGSSIVGNNYNNVRTIPVI